ncbi:sensor histidine kinase N-terminal domain-containing protein [Bradyrhizobium sp. ISRA435]|nr:sensor histidine kinase N-terminal domain-containing protein [Bradyrhizobium sp. ISRA435]
MRHSDLRYSLRVRIIAVLSAVLALGAVILGFAGWRSASIAAQQAYDRMLSGGAIQIAENVYVQGGVVTLEPPVSTIAALAAYDLVFYKVVDPRGVVVAGYEDLASEAGPEQMRNGVVIEDGLYQEQPVRIATVAKQIEDPAVGGWVTIVLAQTTEARRALARDLTLKALGVIAAMSALALLATGYAVTFALKPLTRIEREIVGRRPDDLRPLQTEPPIEIRNLVHAIDDFMRRLSGSHHGDATLHCRCRASDTYAAGGARRPGRNPVGDASVAAKGRHGGAHSGADDRAGPAHRPAARSRHGHSPG